jgi:hypothetical protein
VRGVIQKVTPAVALGTPIAQRRDQEVGPKLVPTTHIGGLNSGEHYKRIVDTALTELEVHANSLVDSLQVSKP